VDFDFVSAAVGAALGLAIGTGFHIALRSRMRLQADELILTAKQEALALREQSDRDREMRLRSLAETEEHLASGLKQLSDSRQELSDYRASLDARQAELAEAESRVEEEIQTVSGLSREAAIELYVSRVEPEAQMRAKKRAREAEREAMAEVDKRARIRLLETMQRQASDAISEATASVVELPSEDMKGRIIGREGRNIRAFEQITGVDVIVDETPEAVVLSCFDPVRRETARVTLMNLMLDGRIHPTRIEELYEKAGAEVARTIREAGDRASERANVSGLAVPVIEMMGRLRFRTSFAQNVLDHSVEVSRICTMLASELGFNVEVAKRAGFLHDIGKALGPEFEGPHALTGMEFLRRFAEKEPVLLGVGAHHHDIAPVSPEAMIVILADTISAARPGARREGLDTYMKRLAQLEQVAMSFAGVERSFAVQAGREVRLIVRPQEVSDEQAEQLAADVAARIERELDYPGQIKVVVIREVRYSRSAQ
jgi:ribonuclease Y